jgi:iron complex outermembrane receptor protein
MQSTTSEFVFRRASRLAALLGSASVVSLAATAPSFAADAAAAAAAVPVEEVLITGSLIAGTQAVGVPVTDVGMQDFQETGALTTTELLRSVPTIEVDATVTPLLGGGRVSYGQNVAIHGYTGSGGDPKTLLLVNGKRWPIQGHGGDTIDPSIVPSLALQRVDILTAGSSAVYGADAITGVINVILRRGFNGAITQLGVGGSPDIGGLRLNAGQLFGRSWSNGNVTLTVETSHQRAVRANQRDYYTTNFEPYGLHDASVLGYSNPAVVTIGAPSNVSGLAPGLTAQEGTRYCADCYAIPLGAGWNYGDQSPGPTTNWTTLQGNQFVPFQRNEENQVGPYEYADLAPQQDKSGAAIFVDQMLTENLFDSGVSVNAYVNGFWSNRRAVIHYPGTAASGNSREHISLARGGRGFTVPTTNPYYPTGAPANLLVHYNFMPELGGARITGVEVARRGEIGLDLDGLPFDWTGNLFYSFTDDMNYSHTTNMINVNAARAALGNTVPGQPGTDTMAAQEPYSKPANIPYLNVFCDGTVYKCNSPQTLRYITGYRNQDESWKIKQIGFNFNGPVWELPGGPILGAVAGEMTNQHYVFSDRDNVRNHSKGIVGLSTDTYKRDSYAFFGQVNIPIIGEEFSFPLAEHVEIELGYRLDKYDFQDEWVKTPKVAGNWNVGHGLVARAAWGKSFRAPGFGQTSATSGSRVFGVNRLGGDPTDAYSMACPAVDGFPGSAGTALPGSVTAILNPTCNMTDPNIYAPAGLEIAGGSGLAAPVRGISLRPTPGKGLGPETAKQYLIGFNFTPTADGALGILNGLAVDVSYFNIKLENTIRADSSGDGDPNNPLARGQFLVIPNPNASIFDPSNAEFLQAVQDLSGFLRTEFSPDIVPGIKFIRDAANTNLGSDSLKGIDFDFRYDWDMANWGAWHIGAAGYYELDQTTQSTPNDPIDSRYEGKNSGGRLHRVRYRAGWTNGTWSTTLFANYKGHTGPSGGTALPLPTCYWAAGFGAGDCYPGSPYYPQPGELFFDGAPAHTEFDLNISYDTGEMFANPLWHNTTVSLTIQNLLDRKPPFMYTSRDRAREIRAYDTRFSEFQRFVTLNITKNW